MNTIKFEGKLMTCNLPNKNGRIYSDDMMKKAIDEYMNNDKIHVGMLSLGDCQHHTLELGEITHKVNSLHVENSDIFVEGEILNTPRGNLVKSLIDDNQELGFEVIGYCDSVNTETHEVNGFKLDRIDILPIDRCAWENCKLIKCENNE